MDSVLFSGGKSQPHIDEALLVEGAHQADALAQESGLWVGAAGACMLAEGSYQIAAQASWIWIAAQSGVFTLHNEQFDIRLRGKECCMVPPSAKAFALQVEQEARMIWFTVSGRLADAFMYKLGALQRKPMKQGALPSQLKLARHIVQAVVRIAAVKDASSAQLQQLLWAILASHSGQPVAMDVVLSHEIAKVIDAMRKNQYRDSFSLADMANLSRMPVETFRKRFVAEVGMPPQSYQLFCKMERAKDLLKNGVSVRQAGAEVGMQDPYHFSKTFKNIVGMSPSSYSKTANA